MQQNYLVLDDDTLSNLEYYMPSGETLRQLASMFSIFCDETRLKILSALSLGDMCVNDLSNYLGINQTTVSHQLRYLKTLGAVTDSRLGKVVVYSIANSSVSSILSNGVDYILA